MDSDSAKSEIESEVVDADAHTQNLGKNEPLPPVSVECHTSESELSSKSTLPRKPPTCIVLGMAGSGKTSVMQRIAAHLATKSQPAYHINLDPAVAQVPFAANIDICDTVNYQEVMKQYGLGPNGAIMTSLNLFATRFEEVMQILEKRATSLEYIFVDTPGQIEVFTWSASGDIITKMLGTTFPTVLIYVVDTTRCTNATTFMSNMLYACSIFYRSQLPLIVCFNKTDVVAHDFAVEWMKDYDSFVDALRSERDDSYMSTLVRSMGLSLQEFYETLQTVGVSAATGIGIDTLFDEIDKAAQMYQDEYIPALEAKVIESQSARAKNNPNMETDLKQFIADHAKDKILATPEASSGGGGGGGKKDSMENQSDKNQSKNNASPKSQNS